MRGMDMRLKDIRKDRGLTIDQVASMTGLSRGFISQIENGRREPGSETLRQIAAAFEVPVSDLFASPPPTKGLAALLDQLTPEEQAVLRTVAQALIAKRSAQKQE